MNDTNELETNNNSTKKSNTVFIIIIIVLILIIAGLLCYFLLFKDKKEENNTTTTTTTTTESTTAQSDSKMLKDLEEYKVLANSANNKSTQKNGIVLLDSTFKDFKAPYCDKKGNKKETADGHSVDISCSDTDYDTEDFDGTYHVDEKFRFEIKGGRTCGADLLYIGENYVINYDPSCYRGGETMTIYNSYNGTSFTAGRSAPYIKIFENVDSDQNSDIYRPVIKDNYLYFVGAQNEGDENHKSKCNIYRLDLNSKNFSFVTSQEFECNFAAMY